MVMRLGHDWIRHRSRHVNESSNLVPKLARKTNYLRTEELFFFNISPFFRYRKPDNSSNFKLAEPANLSFLSLPVR